MNKENDYELIIGSHVSLSGDDYLLGSVKEAISYKADCFMIYTGAPQNTTRKNINLFKKQQAYDLMEQNQINPMNVIVHAPYIINLCSSKDDTRQLAKRFLKQEIERVSALGFNKLVLHPGSRLEQELDVAINQIAEGINYALNNHKLDDVTICLETMAGKGTEVGRQIQELKSIIDLIDKKELIGVCVDTCHISDAGYDINEFDQFLNEFDEVIGINKIKCLHINDSKNQVNTHKDRHENIGYGYIGFNNLLKVIYHPLLNHLPKVLETPYVDEIKIVDDKQKEISISPYKQEIEMIRKKKFVNWLNKEIKTE